MVALLQIVDTIVVVASLLVSGFVVGVLVALERSGVE